MQGSRRPKEDLSSIYQRPWTSFNHESIKIIRNLSEFNIKLKSFFIYELSPVPICNRLLCPSCLAQNLNIAQNNIKGNPKNLENSHDALLTLFFILTYVSCFTIYPHQTYPVNLSLRSPPLKQCLVVQRC